MTLKTRLRDWLGITQFKEDVDAILRRRSEENTRQLTIIDASIFSLIQKCEVNTHEIERIKQLLTMPIDHRLAQAAASLRLLTSFINEIQRDQEQH